jgi:nickel/cobalt exporter
MGSIALFASRSILPDQLYPWLSLTSGIAVGAIGLNLAIQRRKKEKHHHHYHSHSDAEISSVENTSITWKNSIALGISGGLVPCPAALVLLLSAIAWGQITLGLTLVIFFSMGLAMTLTGLGLFLVNAKKQFKKLPGMPRFLEKLPIWSAVAIAIVGLGICLRAASQIEGF